MIPCIILIGCNTIKSNIYSIYYRQEFHTVLIITVMIVNCCITFISYFLKYIRRKFKFYLILLLVGMQYLMTLYFTENDKTFTLYTINLLSKKMLTLCKACMVSILHQDHLGENNNEYTLKSRIFKFIIINGDSIAFIVNKCFPYDISLINFLLVIVITIISVFKI